MEPIANLGSDRNLTPGIDMTGSLGQELVLQLDLHMMGRVHFYTYAVLEMVS